MRVATRSTRVLTILLVLVTASLTIAVGGIRYLERRELAQAGEGLTVVAGSLADEVALQIHERVTDMAILSEALAVGHGSMLVVTEQLDTIRAGSPFYRGLELTDGLGQVVASTDPRTVGEDRSNTESYRGARSVDGILLTDVERVQDTGGGPSIGLATAIRNAEGELQGTLLSTLGVAPFEAIFARRVSEVEVQLPPGTQVEWFFLRRDGTVIADAAADVKPGDDLHALALSRDLFAGMAETGYVQTPAIVGYSHVSGATNAEDLRWHVVLRRQRAEVLAPLHRALAFGALVLCVVLVPTLLALVWTRRAGRRAEAARAVAHARLQAIVDTAQDAVLVVDIEGIIRDFNPAAERIFGWPRAEIVGRPVYELLPEDLRAGQRQWLEDFPSTGKSPILGRNVEVSALRRDGTHIPVEMVVVTIPIDGSFLFCSIVRDITERKRAEEDIRRYTAEVVTSRDQLRQQAATLEAMTHDLALARDAALASARAKAEFLANMSHEIRTPMNGVIGMTNLLLDTALNEEQRDYALTVIHSADALLAVINDILDFSKIEAGKLTLEAVDFDLRTVLEEVADLLAPRVHQKGLKFACVLPPNVPAFRGDPARLRQVVINLLGNAIKFTEAGEVVIEVQVSDVTDTHATLRIGVRDTGIGIPKERFAAIFESFTQADGSTSRRYGGTGLGLTISRQIVALMGGTLGLDSEPGKGSTFWLEVNLEKGTATAEPASLPSLAGRRVLVVDDHETNRRALHGQLTSWGLRSTEVTTGKAGIVALEEALTTDPFDLVIMDMHMPDMDGDETAALIKRDPRLASVPLVLLSSIGARSTDELRAKGFTAGLVKPARAARLERTLAEALGTITRDRPREPAAPARQIPMELRVLLAEDNAINQKVAQRMLERWGCRVDVVGDGAQAVAAWEQKPYDVVLMDMQMPIMDGYEATAEIRKREAGGARRTPIVALTANAMEGDDQRCLAAGMDAYVSKPVNAGLLHAMLGRWAAGSSAVASPAPELGAEMVLNAARLEEVCGNDPDFRRELVQAFLTEAPQLLARIEASISSADASGLTHASHSLKGSSLTLGATALGSVCLELEKLGHEAALDAARDTVARVQREFTRLRAVLGAYLPTSAEIPRPA